MSILLAHTTKTREALINLRQTDRVKFVEERGDTYYVNRYLAWGRTHIGVVTSEVDGQPIKWLKQGIEIVLLDNGIHIYQETITGTAGEITLTNQLATQGNIEIAIKMALEGVALKW
jgi:hypothetical protein